MSELSNITNASDRSYERLAGGRRVNRAADGAAELYIETGSGKKNVSLTDASLEALGIKDFNVTGKFSLKDIDEAIKKVSAARSKAGAQYNALEHAYNYNRNASENLTAANSRLVDLDYGKEVKEKKQTEDPATVCTLCSEIEDGAGQEQA